MIDSDTVEIIKRKDQNKNFLYSKLGMDQTGLYERVIINRKDASVAIDRMDANCWIAEPFLGQRDLFYVENADKQAILDGTAKNHRVAFVRHNFWVHKIFKV